jgi:hypothetical protein
VNFETAMTVLARAAGNDFDDFLTLEGYPPESPTERVPMELMLEAGESIVPMIFLPEDLATFPEERRRELVASVIEEAKGQALEAAWETRISDQLRSPETRARIIGFIEGKLGRAIELEPGEELATAEAAVSRLDGERVREHIERSVGRDDPP